VRIISGKYRGKQLHPPANIPVRPTTDFAKESLFNILNNLIDVEETRVLDLFSGTGSIAFEFFSRGCPHITAVDISHKCISFILRTAETMNAANLKAVRADVFRFIQLPGPAYNLVFADPPYDLEKIDTLPDKIMQSPLLDENGWFVLEHSRNYDFSDHPMFYDHRNYGNVNFTFFRKDLKNPESVTH
jgi:16S rRNA (guanine966-N2)-methyltransferase